MSDYDAQAYSLGVALGLTSYQLSDSSASESQRKPLVDDGLAGAVSAAENLNPLISGLPLDSLRSIQTRFGQPGPDYKALLHQVEPLRDQQFPDSIHPASPRLEGVYRLGVAISLAEAQLSGHTSEGDPHAAEGRHYATIGIQQARDLVLHELPKHKVSLDAPAIEQAYSQITSGTPMKALHSSLQTLRVTYGNVLAGLPFNSPLSVQVPPGKFPSHLPFKLSRLPVISRLTRRLHLRARE